MADDMRSVEGDLMKMHMGGYEPKMEGIGYLNVRICIISLCRKKTPQACVLHC